MAKHQKQIEINGVTKTLQQWAIDLGLTYACLRWRVLEGRTGKELTKPCRNNNFFTGRVVAGLTIIEEAEPRIAKNMKKLSRFKVRTESGEVKEVSRMTLWKKLKAA